MKSLKESAESGKILIAAHRGSSGTAPENTLAAFREAIAAGADMIETDVQFTKDNQLVAFHDSHHFRAGRGSIDIGNMTAEELKEIDAGSWFNSKFSGERIPLLSDIFTLIKDKVFLNIELKFQKHNNYEDKIRQFLNLINEYEMKSQVVVASFHYGLLDIIKQIAPDVPVCAIKIPWDRTLPSKIAEKHGSEVFICSIRQINEKISDDARRHDIFVGVYTVDNEKALSKALKHNVGAIGTNYPAKIKQLLDEHKF